MRQGMGLVAVRPREFTSSFASVDEQFGEFHNRVIFDKDFNKLNNFYNSLYRKLH